MGGYVIVSASQANHHITETVHSLDITDPMGEAAMRSQPLWRRAGPPTDQQEFGDFGGNPEALRKAAVEWLGQKLQKGPAAVSP